MILMNTHNLLIVVGLVGAQGLNCYGQFSKLWNEMAKGAVHFLWSINAWVWRKESWRGVTTCQVLFQQGWPMCSSHLGETLHYHIPYYKGMEVLQLQHLQITTATFTYKWQQHLHTMTTTQWQQHLHTIAATFRHNDSNIHTYMSQHLHTEVATLPHGDKKNIYT